MCTMSGANKGGAWVKISNALFWQGVIDSMVVLSVWQKVRSGKTSKGCSIWYKKASASQRVPTTKEVHSQGIPLVQDGMSPI